MGQDIKHAFISYGNADADWVRTLAENLYRSGLELFFDEWDIAPGDVLVHKLDKGILTSRNGVLVVSPHSLSRPWVQEEYAAMMTRVVAGQQIFIPVLLKDAEMPPFLASRVWVDFRNADGPDYEARVRELVRALGGERGGPPPRGGPLKPPPGSGFRTAGTRALLLSLGAERAELSGDGVGAGDPLPQPRFDGDGLTWKLDRARRQLGPVRAGAATASAQAELELALQDAGDQLARAFLPLIVTDALEAAVAEAERMGATLQLALSIAEPFADLPWETLRLPRAGTLALHPRVALFRKVETAGPAPAVSVPGPLRILVAIGSPEAQNARGELLDMEAELRAILDATDAAQRSGKAFVHILEQGNIDAIRAALTERRYHVLHISCHAAQGQLILEDARGREDRVTAKRLWEQAIPAERAPPLIVLAGCSTGQDTANAGGEEKLPGLARTLVQHGVPAVIAMQASVSDRYATDLMGEVYRVLAGAEEPRGLTALNDARRKLEDHRCAAVSPLRPAPEWATPALFCAAKPLTLYDSKAPFEALKEAAEPVFDPGVVVRRVGDMVGRRSEQRLILRALRDPAGAGVLIHGIGGVGKSTLVAQLLHRLAADDRFLIVSVAGESNPDRVLGAVATRLLTVCLAQGADEKHPWRQVAGFLKEQKIPWRDRFEVLAQHFLAVTPLALLFDNFEDNLSEGAIPDQLGELLALWLRRPGKSRLLFTSRHPFVLPDVAAGHLFAFPLGPLSYAETRKLFRRLDGLRALDAIEQRRAYEEVGGHPRALEYLDAVLRGGTARFTDISARLRQQLRNKGIADPAAWCANVGGGLDTALAATVTIAADDVLLDQLLAQLDDKPLARRLLFAASLYRVPVDELGLIWLVGEPAEKAPDAARQARLNDAQKRLREARSSKPDAAFADIAASKQELEQWNRDIRDETAPPVKPPAGFWAAREALTALSLLATVRFAQDEGESFVVHRWTARALAARMGAEARAAHAGAAAYWLWQFKSRQQSPDQALADLLEARQHLLPAGDLELFYVVSGDIILRLDAFGAWEWEEQLIKETLARISDRSGNAAALLEMLGIVADKRGDYDAALDWYRKSLAIREQLGNRQGMAHSYHHLGIVALKRGDYDAALDWFRKSLAIFEQFGSRAGVAHSYHQLGIVALNRGDYDAALDWHRKSLAIREQLGDRRGVADSYEGLGTLARVRGDYGAALDWYRKSLAIFEQFGDRQKMAMCYHALSTLAHDRGDAAAVLDWSRKSLALSEQLGDRNGMARSYQMLGTVAQRQGDHGAAFDWYRKSLAIYEQLGDRHGMATSLGDIGVLHTEHGLVAQAVPYNLKSLALRLGLQVPQARADWGCLSRQRRALGASAFAAIVGQHFDPDSTRAVLKMLDEFEKA